MAGLSPFSAWLLAHPEAQSATVRARIGIAKDRIQKILDRERVSHQKTLEQKISDQGPVNLRVDPHLVGLALKDLLELSRLKVTQHSSHPWYANRLTPDAEIQTRLEELGPLYQQVSGGGFGNLTGDALELIVFKCLKELAAQQPRYGFQGYFRLDQPKNAQGRYQKVQPPKNVGENSTTKEADFLQFGHDQGVLCIECKNYREWIYPHHNSIKETIVKAHELGCIPLMVARRIHYTAMTNLLGPAGIISHETYFQYYPADQIELAERVKDKTKLGFTDVTATEEPHARTKNFFGTTLPEIVPRMAELWEANRDALYEYAKGNLFLAQLYNEIGSPAAGNWVDPQEEPPEGYP